VGSWAFFVKLSFESRLSHRPKSHCGIQKIYRECREHGMEPPVYDFGMAGLMLTFRANLVQLQAATLGQVGDTAQETYETTQETRATAQETAQEIQGTAQETTQETKGTTQETYEKILTWLRSHPAITRRELASRLGLSDSGIKYHLEKMKAAGVIRRVGATKSGYWEVLK
jgi:ATP-dependent DNA helicase RecG